MPTANCTINGMRSRCRTSPGDCYWFIADGDYGTDMTDSRSWGTLNGQDFIINPLASCPTTSSSSSTSSDNKYTTAIKVTTPNIDGEISSISITIRGFRHSGSSILYASLRTTSVSNKSDTISTYQSNCIGTQSTSAITNSELSPQDVTFTFSSTSLTPNTSYYLFLYTYDTSTIYGFYGNFNVCQGATVTYEETGKVRIYTSSGWVSATPYVYTSSGWVKAKPYVYTSSGWVKAK